MPLPFSIVLIPLATASLADRVGFCAVDIPRVVPETAGITLLNITAPCEPEMVNEPIFYDVDEVTWDLGASDARRHRIVPGEQTRALLSFSIVEQFSFSTQLY